MLKQYRTKAPISYYLPYTSRHIEIPVGTKAVPALAYPNRFWALEWEDMPTVARAYRNYGFLLGADEVEEVGHSA